MVPFSLRFMAVVEIGMTRRQVRRLLGKPDEKISDRKFRGLYSGGAVRLGGTGARRSGAWMYVHTPVPGRAVFVYFSRGRVAKVQSSRLSGD